MSASANPRKLGAVLYQNFELLDLYGPLEMFGCVDPPLEVISVAEQAGPVAPPRGPKTLADVSFDDCPQLDLILVPGGVGTIAELANPKITDFLARQAEGAEITMSVCTGSALLAKAGLLDGLRATSNKQFFALSVAQSERVEWVSKARWVDAGRFVTASGVSAGTDMALAVIERLYGAEQAERICALTEYTRHLDPNTDPFVAHLNELMPQAGA